MNELNYLIEANHAAQTVLRKCIYKHDIETNSDGFNAMILELARLIREQNRLYHKQYRFAQAINQET